jgi:hypothetical protein
MRLKLPVSVQQAAGIIISFLASVHPNQASKEQIGSPEYKVTLPPHTDYAQYKGNVY